MARERRGWVVVRPVPLPDACATMQHKIGAAKDSGYNKHKLTSLHYHLLELKRFLHAPAMISDVVTSCGPR